MIIKDRDLKKFKTVFVFEHFTGTDGWQTCFDNSEDAIHYAVNEWAHLDKYRKQKILDKGSFTVTENNIFLDEDGKYYPENEEINVFWNVYSYERIGDLEKEIEDKKHDIEEIKEDLLDDRIDLEEAKNKINELNKEIEEIKEAIKNLEKNLIEEDREATKASPKVDKEKVDKEMEKYINSSEIYFSFEQIGQIRLGLESGIDVSKYANPKLTDRRMEEIRWGLEDGLDVSTYADPEFDWKQMREIREKLEAEKSAEKKSPELEI